VPEKSGIEVVLCVSLPAGAAAGVIACVQAGVGIADISVINKKKFRRTFMLRSSSGENLIRKV
jgi:hypothetical protein